MEEHFYLIPISSNSLFINDVSINELFKENYPIINELEKKKTILTSNGMDTNHNIDKIIDKTYESFNIPKYLIVTDREVILKELITSIDVTTDNIEEIKQYIVDDIEYVGDYYFSSNYKDKIHNLFKTYGFINRKGTLKKRLKK